MKRCSLSAMLPLSLVVCPLAEAAPKNVIYMIGDGMGPAYLSAYRYYQAGAPNPAPNKTVFDSMLVGMAISSPDDHTWVTDSAAAATALATGVKSYNGAIAVDRHQRPLSSLFDSAKKAGKTVGVVATSQVNHATPASFVAHQISRHDYHPIADQIRHEIDAGQLDIVFGGGISYFREQALTYQGKPLGIATDWTQLAALEQTPAVALLAEVALPYALDSDRPQRLAELTDKALQLAATNPNGFSLMIEGSQIDWCGHANDIACAMAEMDDFAAAVVIAKAFVDQNPETLLVVTADHSTGGLTLGADGKYLWLPDEVKKVHASAETIAKSLRNANKSSDAYQQVWNKSVDFPLNEAQLTALLAAEPKELVKKVTGIISARSYTGWTTTGHTAVDVPLMAYGVGAEHFRGTVDNSQIMQIIESL